MQTRWKQRIYTCTYTINLGPKTRCTDNSDTDIHTVGSWPSHFLDLDSNANTFNGSILTFTDISDPDLHRYFVHVPWPSHGHFGSRLSRTLQFGPWQKHFTPWPLHTLWPHTMRDTLNSYLYRQFGPKTSQTIWNMTLTDHFWPWPSETFESWP